MHIIIEDETSGTFITTKGWKTWTVQITHFYIAEESIDWFKDNEHPDLIFHIQTDGLSFETENIEIKKAL
jgi:hypothetical protein